MTEIEGQKSLVSCYSIGLSNGGIVLRGSSVLTQLTLGERGRGTLVETLHGLVHAAGFAVTVRGANDVGQTVRAIVDAVPVLGQDHEVRANGLVVSRVGMYRVVWGVVGSPGGSLAVLTPHYGYEGQDSSEFSGPFMREVVNRVKTLSTAGFSIGAGGQGMVSDEGFALEFGGAYAD